MSNKNVIVLFEVQDKYYVKIVPEGFKKYCSTPGEAWNCFKDGDMFLCKKSALNFARMTQRNSKESLPYMIFFDFGYHSIESLTEMAKYVDKKESLGLGEQPEC